MRKSGKTRTNAFSFACAAALLAVAAACAVPARNSPVISEQSGSPAIYYGRIVNVYPHDPGAYTQGLVYHNGFLFESTGIAGRSSLRKVRLESGEVIQRRPLDSRYFAEGLALWQNRLIQLTWISNIGFVYDLETFKVLREFDYTGEGWGLTHDGTRLILSDGSSTLRFLDPSTYREVGRIPVNDGGEPIDDLNELEFVRNEIYANIWHSDRIARIDPRSGRVTGWIDLHGLLPAGERTDPEAVLNGIAYDAAKDRLFVTGKLWPKLFEIRQERK